MTHLQSSVVSAFPSRARDDERAPALLSIAVEPARHSVIFIECER
jgi:hypothetical protein